MPALNRSAEAVVTAFASRFGLPAVAAEDGSVSFAFERSGRLTVQEAQTGEVLVSLTRPILLEGLRNIAPLLGSAGFDPLGPAIHAGLTRAGQPVVVARIDPRDFDLSRLEQCRDRLEEHFTGLGL